MGSLQFPCEQCRESLTYQQLLNHSCTGTGSSKRKITKEEQDDNDLEIIEVSDAKKPNVFDSLGLNWKKGSKKSSLKRRQSFPIKTEPSKSKISAKEGMKHLGLILDGGPKKPSKSFSEEEIQGNFQDSTPKYYDKLDHLLDEKTIEIKKLTFDSRFPLSEILRPKNLIDYVGNEELVGSEGIIMKYIQTDNIPSMIFWGPTGVGKTTLVRLILIEIKKSKFAKYYQVNELNGASSSVNELKMLYEKFRNLKSLNPQLKMVIFLDEIHRFNKLQQDFFLNLIENKELIFFGCTTENPSYKINDAMLSRCQLFKLVKPVAIDLLKIINSGLLYINKSRIVLKKGKPLLMTKKAKEFLANACEGDYRLTLNCLEMLASNYSNYVTQKKISMDESKKSCIDIEEIKDFMKSIFIKINTTSTEKDLFSALKKSIIGSDANAAIIYLAYMFEKKIDPLEVVNFLLELLINYYDESRKAGTTTLLEFGNTVYYVVTKLGLPECDMAIVQFVYLLCEAEKSNAINNTTFNIENFLSKNPTSLSLSIPMHIRNAPTALMKELGYHEGYKYNPNFKDGKVNQYYLPRGIRKVNFVDSSQYGDLEDEIPKEKDTHKMLQSMLDDLCE